MTGLDGKRVYLDWNATAPLRPEARAAMLEAMDVVGNPSSVHAEGRAAKKIVENARGQVAALVGCEPSEVVFTSGATEAAHQALSPYADLEVEKRGWSAIDLDAREPTVMSIHGASQTVVMGSGIEHDCVAEFEGKWRRFSCFSNGQMNWLQARSIGLRPEARCAVAVQSANSETGVIQRVRKFAKCLDENDNRPVLFSDMAQSLGKEPVQFRELSADLAAVSAHKCGGPKGVGALIILAGASFAPNVTGGGQEQGRRSGTENVIGIAGFGAAAEAAQRDLEAGVWEPVEKLRDILEERLADAAKETVFLGQESPRLPNTSCFAVPGWKGETQVMQMDLAGFAVSAGSACSSGKVNKASRVLLAMGFDEITASSAIRVSMGPTTTEAEVMAFTDTWIDAYRRRKARAA